MDQKLETKKHSGGSAEKTKTKMSKKGFAGRNRTKILKY